MDISVEQYRVRVGVFNNRSYKLKVTICIDLTYCIIYLRNLSICVLYALLLIICGDVEVNPGPSSNNSHTTISSDVESFSTDDDSGFTNGIRNYISLFHLNIQSIYNKLDIINGNLYDFDILCFTETWLNQSFSDDQIVLNGFQKPYRCDRVGRIGGGVIVYCKENLISSRRNDLELGGLECIWIEIKTKQDIYLIGTFYRPPNSDNNYWNLIEQSIDLAVDTKIKSIIITGDFNENQLNINNNKVKDILSLYDLHQLITVPTSITENSETLIDLLITNNTQNVIYSNVFEPFLDVNIRFHKPIVALLKSPKFKNQAFKRKIWIYSRGNYDLFRQKISETNWNELINEENSIDLNVELLTNKILDIASLTIPNRIITVRQTDIPWLTTDIRKLIRKREKIRKRLKTHRTSFNINKYKQIRNKIVNLLRNAKRKYHESICEKIKTSQFASKNWWTLIKQLTHLSNKPSNLNILVENDIAITDDREKADLLNNFFASQSTLDDKNCPSLENIENPVLNYCTIESIQISVSDVKDLLKLIDTSKATGPDSISPKILKEAYNELAYPLSKIFNLSLACNTFPNKWKLSNIVPIFKKNNPKFVENYRPISLLSVISKIFEKCIFKYLHNYIISNNIISRHQSGFTKGDSTINQLLFITNEFSQALDHGKEIRVVFFDISKAFDRVWHKGLLFKIQKIGIRGNLLSWIKSYLSGRVQKVVINGKESSEIRINAGVPQGSILGPLFFLLFINDIVLEIGCCIKLFADDTTIYIIIENPNTDAQLLNNDLSKVHQWSHNWLVKFNPQKTESMLITRKHNHIQHPPLFFDNHPVTEVTTHKHLGLLFNTTCHWGDHIDQIICKANAKLNILRNLKFDLDRKTLEIMYFTFIRPTLEYGDIIYDNCPNYYKEKLEKINTEAARIVTGGTKLVSLEELYRECGWEKLEKRRENHKLIQFYKMINGHTPSYLNELIPNQHNQTHQYNTRNSNNIVNIQCKTSYHFNSFIPSTIRLWNLLPNNVRESNNVASFKNALSSLSNITKIPNYYNIGTRKGQILHARLRMRCSSLKYHLFTKNIESDPYCECGQIENTSHYLLECPRFSSQRQSYIYNLNIPLTSELLLRGDPYKSFDFNKRIFINVQNYIINTQRFH